MTDVPTVKGSCLCEAIEFEVQLPSNWVAHCHCSLCRRAHGAGYVTWAGFNDDKFHLTKGESSLKWYSSTEQGKRGFCRDCGSTLFFRSPQWQGEMHIAVANFHQNLDKKPQVNAYYATHVDWMPVDKSLKIIE